ncbi:translation initiation factor eIF-2B [Marinospirillum alkaliphilum]|uniref:Translation initiation factor eIF-2B subunit delta n=1 Tax=Marinospirillum alkaliphilum DSM 21637 TaxID=1122209 RepID=A0A1K1UEG7_9GAMM|nr:translation initiation factor eIF-2B [Marinospirillum alkaliphilum]SFX10803.1 translation initiation factor eIF-2B subunit delta [Marinospirillum alkaliphilum DSM 21637]
MYGRDNEEFKARRLRAVKADLNSGASVLARKALEDIMDYADACEVADVAELQVEITDLADRLSGARPSMVVVSNVLKHFVATLPDLPDDLKKARGRAAVHAEEVIEQVQQAQARAVEFCMNELTDGMTIMTHSVSSSVMQLFTACQRSGKQINAIITESRPGMEGRNLARYLNKLGVQTQFITEAQMAHFVVQADKVIVGADSLLRDGSLVNKTGTRLLALAAKDAGIPFWVLAESFKHSLVLPEDVVLEEMPEEELQLESMPNVQLHNIYFDLIPARLITAWADEQGVRVIFRSLAEGAASLPAADG